MKRTATVYLVDDDAAVCDSFRLLLKSAGLNLKSYGSAQEFLDDYDGGAGCLVLDLRLPGMSGLELQEQLNRRRISLPVILLTGHGDVPTTVRALKAGAVDYLEKPCPDDVLLERVREAIDLHRKRLRRAKERQAVDERRDRLTPREREVMGLMVSGMSNKEIAAHLGISRKTLDIHRAHVIDKMEARSVADLVRMNLAEKVGS